MKSTTLLDTAKRIFNDVHQDEKVLEGIVQKYEEKTKRKIGGFVSENAVTQVGNVIDAIPPQGIKIAQPGIYYFTNDLIWLPGTGENISAINIDCDNVVLDLNGHKLTAVPPNNTQGIVGINVPEYILGRTNITIQNGELINMSYHGISVAAVNNVNIVNMTVQGSEFTYFGIDPFITPAGILVDMSNYVNITGCSVSGVNVTAPAYAGIQLYSTTNATVSGCNISNLINRDGTVTGFSYVEKCKQVVTINCHSSGFRSHYHGNPLGKTVTLGHTVLGFLPTGCSQLHYEGCTATSLRGCCDDCHGMSIFDSDEVTVIGFRATGILDGDASVNTGAKATGIEVYGNNILVKFCVVENIFAIVPQDRQSCGFSAAGKNITFESCVANNVLVFDENRNPTNEYARYGYGIGFGWAPDPRPPFVTMYAQNTIYLNCTAVYCQVGFDTWNHIDGFWENWSAEKCNIGVLQQPGETRIFSMNECSELPPDMKSPMAISNNAANNTFMPPV